MMRRAFHALLAVAALAAFAAAPAAQASAWLNTQHGGRGTGQAGALTARADDPSALTYNPAGIVRLPGIQLQAGLDFSNATDDYESPTAGRHEAHHSIQFPPALYLTYHLKGDSPWAVGVGIDTPVWYSVDWKTALFPGRFLTRETKLRLWELHPVVAYQIDDHWSVGGGLRYITGEQELGQNYADRLAAVPGQRPEVPYEVKLTANGTADALSFDAGVQYATHVWGWGAVYRHSADLTSKSDYEVQVRDITDPSLSPTVVAGLGGLRVDQSFALPKELRTGFWIAPYPELRLELDAAYADWTRTETRILEPSAQGPVLGSILETRTRDWNSTLSLRFGVEGDLTDHWTVYGGAAREPSPVPTSNVEPAWPRGDATVLGGGFSYNLPWISFDMSYSYWNHSDRTVTGQELAAPTVRSTYTAFEQVWAASVRWRW